MRGPNKYTYSISKDLHLDVLLIKIGSFTMYYSSQKARERKVKRKDVITQIKILQDMWPSQLYSELLSELKTELEEITKYELKGILTLSWIYEFITNLHGKQNRSKLDHLPN
jgi:glycine cleavage system protein P-like pyridoxal-binding family